MPIINRIADFHAEMTEWRHRLHTNPETAFEEHETSEFVAERLTSFGISVERGIAGTGVVGTLHGSVPGPSAIALRADGCTAHRRAEWVRACIATSGAHACLRA
jgi:metal-dependent amidase/aminoacylase/carboxypeptidase family protein